MNEKYELKALNQPEFKIKVIGMSEEGIIKKLRKQNQIFKK